MILDTTFFLLAIPAVIFAGISKGGFGSGAAFVAAPLMALIVDPALAVGLMLPLLMLIDAATLKPYWKQWSWPDARLLILGAAPGVGLGALFWRAADADMMRIFLGVISLGFVAFQLARTRNLIRIPARPFAPGVGVIAGTIGGLYLAPRSRFRRMAWR